MKVKELDVVLIKDGRVATILDIYSEGKAFLVEIDGENVLDEEKLIFIELEEIEKITYVA
jgi:hypothetical protein